MNRSLSLIRAVFLAQARDVMRNRWVLAYAATLALLTEAMFQLGGSGERTLTGLLNVVLLLVPLVATVFGVVYWHAAREFTELLLAQPVPRRTLWFGLYFGLVLPLIVALVVGIVLPLALHRAITPAVLPLLAVYLLSGALLTLCFGALALWIGARQDDRLKALGMALGVWFVSTVAYDGLVVWFTTVYADWPLERPMLALMMGNPVDLTRTALMLRIDSAALMGYTGAVLSQVLGGTGGLVVTAVLLLGWAVAPAAGALRAFTRKDF